MLTPARCLSLVAFLVPLGGVLAGCNSSDLIARLQLEEQATRARCECWMAIGGFESQMQCEERGLLPYTSEEARCLEDLAQEQRVFEGLFACQRMAVELERDCYRELTDTCLPSALQACRDEREANLEVCDAVTQGVGGEGILDELDRCL
ncbi:MAG: hypothetical protein ACFCGT_18145 [Sandaracinaceae bacterium]